MDTNTRQPAIVPPRRILLTVSALFAVVIAGAYVWRTTDTRAAQLLQPDDSATVATGRQIYAANCASCHGAKLEGQPDWKSPGPNGRMPAPPHDRSGHTWHHADQVLFDLTKYGLKKFAGNDYQSDMPAYDGVLSDDQIVAVLSYIKSTWPEQIRNRHDRINAAAAEKAQ